MFFSQGNIPNQNSSSALPTLDEINAETKKEEVRTSTTVRDKINTIDNHLFDLSRIDKKIADINSELENNSLLREHTHRKQAIEQIERETEEVTLTLEMPDPHKININQTIRHKELLHIAKKDAQHRLEKWEREHHTELFNLRQLKSGQKEEQTKKNQLMHLVKNDTRTLISLLLKRSELLDSEDIIRKTSIQLCQAANNQFDNFSSDEDIQMLARLLKKTFVVIEAPFNSNAIQQLKEDAENNLTAIQHKEFQAKIMLLIGILTLVILVGFILLIAGCTEWNRCDKISQVVKIEQELAEIVEKRIHHFNYR